MISFSDIVLTSTYVPAQEFANADTIGLELDVRSTNKDDCVAFRTAGKNRIFGIENILRAGFYTIRRQCEYLQIRLQQPALGAPFVNLVMLSRADMPEGETIGAPR